MKAHKNLLLAILFGGISAFSCSPQTWKAFIAGPEAVFLSPVEKTLADPCKQTIHYAPSLEHPTHTPMRYIKVRMLVMQHKPDDPWTLTQDEAELLIDQTLVRANYKLSLNAKMTLPVGNETPVLPINYRFVLDIDPANPDDTGIDFAIDSALAYFNVKSGTSGHYDRRAFDKYATNNGNVLTLVVQEHHPDSAISPTYRGVSTGTGFPNWIKMVGCKQFMTITPRSDGGFDIEGTKERLLLHETGHSFGLMHTWSGSDGCDDTPHHPNCWDHLTDRCPDGIHSNNMMDYNNTQSALTPCQLGIVNYNFSRLGSPQRKYLIPTWCDYKADSTIDIYANNVEWNSAKDLEGDIIVQNGGRLTIRCRVSLPEGARIIIKPKGTLVLDGAHLTNLCNQQWEGIERWGNAKDTGSLVIYATPTIDNVRNPIVLR